MYQIVLIFCNICALIALTAFSLVISCMCGNTKSDKAKALFVIKVQIVNLTSI